MTRPPRLHGSWYVLGAAGLSVLGYGVGRQLGHTGIQAAPSAAEAKLPPDATLQKSAQATRGAGSAVPKHVAPDPAVENVIEAQRKRIMGRLRSLEHVRRVATTIRPLIDRALESPALQGQLAALARDARMSLPEYKKYFAGKQEADILLESGGDPNARSVADAVGVAQYLAGTGRACGLKIDLGQSNRLSREITALESQLEALAELPADWTRPVPVALRGVVPTLPPQAKRGVEASLVPAAASNRDDSIWTRDQWLAYRKMQWEQLVDRRRQADERFDPAKAITAQTRYLVQMTRNYGGIDWTLQAYHGGEAGASRTMRLFAGAAGPQLHLASRKAGYTLGGPGRWLPYSELYRRVSPSGTPDAFGYLFGRSDDHRYYWWKVLMAERALDLYRRDPAEFEKQWRALQPGLSADAVWYPEPKTLEFADNSALRKAYKDGTLVALPGNAYAMGIQTDNLAALDPASAGLHKGLRPEAMGALLRLAHIYRSSGGRQPLTVQSMVQSAAHRRAWRVKYPDPPLPPDIPRDPEFHAMGVTFDLARPAADWDRKVLEYSLGRLYDTLRISWRKEREAGHQRYHVVVNPGYRAEMVQYSKNAAR